MANNNKKRILLLIKVPPPITGATLMNKRLYNSRLLRERFDVGAILISYAKSLEGLGKKDFYKLYEFIKVFCLLLYELIFRRPHLIYFQISPTGVAFFRDSLYVLLMKIFPTKIVFHLRGRGIRRQVSQKTLLRIYYRCIFRNTSVICLSELLVSDIAPVYSEKPFILYNGIPEIVDYRSRNFKHFDARTVNLLFLSNLIVSKGILDFMTAVKILRDEGHHVRGIVVGAEAELKGGHLQTFIKKNRLVGALEYRGALYRKNKQDVMAESDLFIFPTYYPVEAFPGVVLEAMQFEMPVIATKECSLPLIVDENVTGIFVDKKSPDQIANAVKRLIGEFEVYKQMAVASRKRFLEKFTFSRYEEDMINVLATVLGVSHA